MFRRILIAYDGSAGSRAALARACDLARTVQAECHVVTVVHPSERPDMAVAAEEALMDAVSSLAQAGVQAIPRLLKGHPVEQLLRLAADASYDLVVVGDRGHSAVDFLPLGSVAAAVTRQAACPVLVVREGSKEATA